MFLRTQRQAILTCSLSAGLASLALPQGLPPSLVSDTAGDTIWMCTDANQDGDYADAGELSPFYDDQVGAIPLTNNVGLIRLATGEVFITDTSEDIVLRLADSNGDGDALDLGEATVWFDGTSGNSSGVELTSARGMWADADGTIWAASANTGGGGNDAIVRLVDVNGDGDANDAGEQLEFYVIAPGGSVGDSIPTAVSRGTDGALYYVETGSTGALTKGVYRLEDLNGSGVIDSPNEVTPFFIPAAQGGSPFHWDLGRDAQGRFYLNDTGNDVVWRFADTGGNGTVDPVAEADIIYTASGSSLIWEVSPAADGSIYIAEDQNPDRLIRLVDIDGDDFFGGPGEVQTIYDESTAATNIGSPKAVFPILASFPVSVQECLAAVPNSTGVPGRAAAFGSTSVSANNLLLRGADLPQNQFGILVVSRDLGMTSIVGSQGLLCLGGSISRYGTILNTGSSGSFELAIDLTAIPQMSSTVAGVAGETWRFQAWHRDVNPTATSNFTDVAAVTMTP